ncbi:hypothetical protein GF361_00500 [Candidatus Woesearchaeota archaeon]|nr:hypothetical protein [Candidatus Woesearchaeota archaeon]
MEEFEGLPTNFKDYLKYEIEQAEELERVPGIMLLKLDEKEKYLLDTLEEILFIMDYHNIKFADKHCIDYVGWCDNMIGLYFQNADESIVEIKEGVLKEINNRIMKELCFDNVGTAVYDGKRDNIDSMLERAYQNG